MRSGVVAGTLAIAAALCGCAPVDVDPMNDAQRDTIARNRADRYWVRIATEYPEALRPEVSAGPLLSDAGWPGATKKCFNDGGFQVKQDGPEFQYASSSGQSQIDFVVASYSCRVRVVRANEVAVYLTPDQLGRIYDYYTKVVRPCLAYAGYESTSPPERALFVEQFFAYIWHPYDAVVERSLDATTIADLEKRCPPVPRWLHL